MDPRRRPTESDSPTSLDRAGARSRSSSGPSSLSRLLAEPDRLPGGLPDLVPRAGQRDRRLDHANLTGITGAIKDAVSYGLLNPVEGVLTSAPVWLVIGAIFGIAWFISGLRRPGSPVACLVLLVGLSLWEHSMQTLDHGHRRDRHHAGDRHPARDPLRPQRPGPVGDAARPGLRPDDAGVRLPHPGRRAVRPDPLHRHRGLGHLRRAGRHPAGRRGHPRGLADGHGGGHGRRLDRAPAPLEGPAAAGPRTRCCWPPTRASCWSSRWSSSGPSSGAGALGYDVIAGFAQREDFGKGLAAGIAIVLLGIMLDRITQGVGGRRPSDVMRDRPRRPSEHAHRRRRAWRPAPVPGAEGRRPVHEEEIAG